MSTTSRLWIRPYADDDYAECVSLYGDANLTAFFDHGKPRSEGEVRTYIAERTLEPPFGLFSVFLRERATFIGQVDAVPTGVSGEVEIGWIFRKEFHNRGYCTEAVRSFLIPLVQQFSGERIIATAHPKNGASQRIMAKAGLSHFKSEERYGGHPRDWYELSV